MRRRCYQTPSLPFRSPPHQVSSRLAPSCHAKNTPLASCPEHLQEGTSAHSRRYLAIHFPYLATDGLGSGPLALWSTSRGRRVLTAVNPEAAVRGVSIGQSVADALTRIPNLRILPDTLEHRPARLSRLARWALAFTPLVAPVAPDGLLLDITGCAHLAGGETPLRERIIEGLGSLGYTAHAAIASTPTAALLLARAGLNIAVPPGSETTCLSPLSLDLLRVPADILAALQAMGIRQIGDLLAQPRDALIRRFGQPLREALQALSGDPSPPLSSISPRPKREAALSFASPIATQEAIEAAAETLTKTVCRSLEQYDEGARRFVLRAKRTDRSCQEIVIGTGEPSRDPAHLFHLFRNKLGALRPDHGFERFLVRAEQLTPLPARQRDFHSGKEDLAALLDRLAQRVKLWRPKPCESHLPERAIERVSVFTEVRTPPDWPRRIHPVRLLRRPCSIEAIALLPDAPPRRIRWNGRWHTILSAEGPDRVEAEWWRDPPDRPMREYFHIMSTTGQRLWVCRVGTGRASSWYLHGIDA